MRKIKADIEENISSIKILRKFWAKLKSKRKQQIKLLTILMLISGFSEMLTIGTLFPFLSILIDKKILLENNLFKNIVLFFGIENHEQFLLFTTIIFLITVFISVSIRLLNMWITARLTAAIGSDLSSQAFGKTLYQPYSVHLKRNSNEVIASIGIQINYAVQILESTLYMISALLNLVFILASLFWVNWYVALTIITSFGSIYYFIRKFNLKRLERNSRKIDLITKEQIKYLNEGFGSIKDILLDNTQRIYIDNFRKRDLSFRLLSAQNSFIASSPRFILEGTGIFLIASIAYLIVRSVNYSGQIIPVLGVIALGLQKLLPMSQILYSSWAILRGSKDCLLSVLKLLDQPTNSFKNLGSNIPMKFKDKIEFENVYFRYNDKNKFVVRNLSFSISKGDIIGIIGKTGSGKSTLIDLLMSLLIPTKGFIYIDNEPLNEELNFQRILQWRSNIAHVPQNVFLSDGSISENIAFGIPKNEIDLEKVVDSAKKAQINDFIFSLPNRYETRVGERGTRLSGGQIQRIAIARALYKEASLLILDEATSALDSSTEKEVIKSIYNLNKELTLVIIAHRISTLDNCNRVFELNEGSLISELDSKEFEKRFSKRF